MIILLSLACAMSMAQEPIEQQSYPIDYAPVQEETQKMLSSIDAIELFLQDKQDFEKFCPSSEWIQPCLDDYKAEAKSYLPDTCLPEEEKKAREETKAIEP